MRLFHQISIIFGVFLLLSVSTPVLGADFARFAAVPSTGTAPLNVSFIDLSNVSNPADYNYSWNFGDGTFSTLPSPVHEYLIPDNYPVTLRLTSILSPTDTDDYSEYVYVYPSSPHARFTWVADQDYVPAKVRFIDQSYSDVEILSWNWDFSVNGVLINTSSEQNPEVTFVFDDPGNAPSNVAARLTVIDANGETFSATQNIAISSRLFPLAGFAAVLSSSPNTVAFIDQTLIDPVVVGDGRLQYEWEWDFGDGTNTSVLKFPNQNPVHTYATSGTYNVTQVAWLMDANLTGRVRGNAIQMDVTIPPSSSSLVEFTWVSNQDHVPMKVRFIDQSSSDISITSWDWTFTDENGNEVANSTEKNPVITFVSDDPAQFNEFFNVTARLTVYDVNGASLSTSHDIEISPRLFPQARFAIVPSDSPSTVTFVDQTLVDPVITFDGPLQYEWEWDFGDGTNSTLKFPNQNPVHSYDAPGIYNTSLVVWLCNGICDGSPGNRIRGNFVQVDAIIPDSASSQAQFTWVSNQDYVPMKVRFIDQSYSDVGVASWDWTFAVNGTQIANSTEQNPEITFDDPAIFDDPANLPPYITATLTTTDGSGRTFSVIHNVPVSSRLFPLAGFAAVLSESSRTVTFVDQTLIDPVIAGDGRLQYEWEWDFGDGNTAIVRYPNHNPVHTYDASGIYHVTQIAWLLDANLTGRVRGNAVQMDVIVLDPLSSTKVSAHFAVTPPSGIAPLNVSFIDLSTIPDHLDFIYYWDFGDGTSSSEKSPVHEYTNPGNYLVRLNITSLNPAFQSSEYTLAERIHVFAPEVNPLIAQFTAAPRIGLPPLAVSFTDLSVDAVKWKWDFGDGTLSYEQHPLHTYTQEGTYAVVLQIWDKNNQTAMVTEANFVRVSFAPKPLVDFAAVPQNGSAPLSVSFIDQTIAYGPIDSWFWDFGNGLSSHEKNPTTVYSTPGTYNVTLTVTTRSGSDSETKPNFVTVEGLQADFVADPTSGLPPLNVSFTDKSTGAPILWKWEFGDGQTSNEPNPFHIYTNPGKYDVTLTIYDAYGKTSTITKPEIVRVFDPRIQANFIWDNLVGLTVQFTDISAGAGIISWEWNFNDGSPFSYEQHPRHTFPASGTYVVILEISNGIYKSTKYKAVNVP